MFKFLQVYAEYLSKQRKVSNIDSITAEITSTESNRLQIDENVKKMLKSSYDVLEYPLHENRTFSKQDDHKLTKLQKKMQKILEKTEENKKKLTDVEFNNSIALALAAYNFGIVHMKYEEMPDIYILKGIRLDTWYDDVAYDNFKSCIDLLTDKKLNRKVILLYMRALSNITYIQIKQQNYKDCYECLLEAFYTYVDYTQNNKYPNPVDVATILDIDDREYKTFDTKMSLDDLHIKNLNRLYHVYDNNLMDKHEYVALMHDLLNTQIQEVFLNKNYIEWAMGATELSRFFIQHESFTKARHYLAAASYMMKKNETEHFATIMKKISKSDNQNSIEESLNMDYDRHQYQCAKINKLWGQYGLHLLSASKENLLKNITNQSCETDNFENFDSITSNEESNKESQKMFIFTSLEDKLNDIIDISDKYLSNFRDIKIVFEKVLEWFNTAIKYFSVEKDIKIYGEIILQMSLAYKYFADCERHKDKQLKVYEQQIALLHNALEKILDDTAINDIQNLMLLELGISYATISNIKINDEVRMYKKIPNQTLLQMKNYIENSLNRFISYSMYLP